MQRLVKQGELVANPWQIADETFELAQLNQSHWLIPLSTFLKIAETGELDFSRCGPILQSDDDVEVLRPYAEQLTVVALEFKAFMDGRSFSQARLLRDELDYEGELRAIGAYMLDQLFYLSRCGVDAFLLPNDAKFETAVQILQDFSESYQAACDEPQPLFRRRV